MSSPEIGIPNYLGIALAAGFLAFLLAAIILAARQIRHIRSSQLKWILLTGVQFLLLAAFLTVVELIVPSEHVMRLRLREAGVIMALIPVAIGALGLLLVMVGILSAARGESERQRPPRERLPREQPPSDPESNMELVRSIMNSSLHGMMTLRAIRDTARNIVDFEIDLVNPAAQEIIGKPASVMSGARALEMLPCLAESGLLGHGIGVVETKLPFRKEIPLTSANQERWYQFVAVRHLDGLVATFADITDRKQAEEKLRLAARHDALTGLPNRAMFLERLGQAIHRSQHIPEYHFAVLFLDFDRFKLVNDSLGHDIGDQLLISIADRLRANIRAVDLQTRQSASHLPARLGGDEFVILLDGICEPNNVVIVGERLQEALAPPHDIAGHQITATASIGIVTSEGDYTRAEDVVRDADIAMYHAKGAGKARQVVFDADMHAAVMEQATLEQELRDAVERRVFIVEYQPIVSLKSGRIAGFEALIRWPHGQRGMLLPISFLPFAEELGLIVEMGESVLRTACGALRKWMDQTENSDLFVSVNLSRQELMDPHLTSRLERIISETGVKPGSVHLEIAESICMNYSNEADLVLRSLKDLGFVLVMDDFGTGHSTLGSLDKFPFDIVKIDQCIGSRDRQWRQFVAITKAMVELVHTLDMPVVAEGIETQEQVNMLQKVDCDFGQGWLFSRAVSEQQAGQLLLSNKRWMSAA